MKKKPVYIGQDQTNAVENAMFQIEKQFGKGYIMKLGDQSAQIKVNVIPSGSIGLDAAGDLSPPNFHNTLGDVLNEGGHQSRLPAGQLDVGGLPGGAYTLGDEVQGGVCHLNGHPSASTVAAVTVGTSEIAGRGRPQDEITHGHDRARSL